MQHACARAPATEPLAIPMIEPSHRRPLLATFIAAAVDALCLSLASLLSVFLAHSLGDSLSPDRLLRSLIVVPVTMIVFAANKIYPPFGSDEFEEAKQITRSICFIHLGWLCGWWVVHPSGSQSQILISWIVATISLPLGRAILRGLLCRKSWWGEPVLLMGSGVWLEELLMLLDHNPRTGLHAVGILGDFGRTPSALAGLRTFQDLDEALLFTRQRGVRTAIVALGGAGSASISEVTSRYAAHFQRLIVLPPMSPKFNLCSRVKTLGGYLGIQISQNLLSPVSKMSKRYLDLCVAAVAGIVLLPFMLLIALAVMLTSPGPVFYGHRRIGRDGAPFLAWKFRTMVSNADTLLAERLATNPALRLEWERDHKLRKDPRITSIGALLRRYSLDELPQLWNVVRSEMSIVGPRPICSAEIPKYAEYFADYSGVLPGITGLWQVSGRNETTYQERVRLDTYYANNWSPWLDLYILARTVGVVFSARGAY